MEHPSGPSEAEYPEGMAVGRRVVVVVGFLLHVLVGVLILVSGLIMPIWAVAVLAILWVVALAIAIRWRTRPVVVLAVPLTLFAIGLITAWLGEEFLDWTA